MAAPFAWRLCSTIQLSRLKGLRKVKGLSHSCCNRVRRMYAMSERLYLLEPSAFLTWLEGEEGTALVRRASCTSTVAVAMPK